MMFRKKPVVIQAVQFLGTSTEAAIAVHLRECVGWFYTIDGEVAIPTLEGVMIARRGDWIIRGVQGEYYPCKPDIFAATYEAVTA